MCDKITNIHNIETNEYLENINVEPQYLHATEQVDARGYYKDIFNYFNPNPIEIIDDNDTNYIDYNHYPECDRHLLDYDDCICFELLLEYHLDLEMPDPLDFELPDHTGPPAPAG